MASFLKEGRDSDEEGEKPKKKKEGIHKDHYMDDDEPKKKKRKYKLDKKGTKVDYEGKNGGSFGKSKKTLTH